jgi:hypothetical protein
MENKSNGTELKGQELENWWQSKLDSGRWGEKQVANHLVSKGWTIVDISNGSEWDIKAEKDGDIKTFEVKTNYYEIFRYRHQMVVIETESNGVLSGLSTTTADFYVLYYPFENLFYIESVFNIKRMVKSGQYKKVIGGRKDLATMYQIPRTDFIHKKRLHFMDYLDEDTKEQWWWEWYEYKYLNESINLI